MRNQKEIYISDCLKKRKVSNGAIGFLLELLTYFEISNPITTTTKKLATGYGRGERSIQRYVRELSKDHAYLYVKHNYDNKNIEKPIIVSNTYTLTSETKDIISQAEGFANRRKNVGFILGA
jgi:hypothetical protein